MTDHRLKLIEVRHFKRFERVRLQLEPFNLLVGPNNSGKSTLLQACALFDFCYRSSLERHNGELRFANKTFGPEEFTVVPAAAPVDLWLNHRTRRGQDPIPLRVEAKFRSGVHYAFEVALRYNRFSVQADKQNSLPVPPEEFGIVFIPGYAGFWPREERRTPAVVREMRGQGQHGAVIRNLLLDLRDDDDADRWEQFRTLLAEIFPDVVLHAPEFDEQVDRYIRATYSPLVSERLSRPTSGRATGTKRPAKPERFDLFAAGAGFHQFVQIFGGVFSERATTILLDEPDAHLFSRLQSRLYSVLMKLVEQGRQVIAASHSPELIAAARPHTIISFANGAPRRLQVRADVSGTARALGAFENVGLLLIDAYERVVVVEDRSDELLLKAWLERVLPPDEVKVLLGRLVFLYAHGRPAPDVVQHMLTTIQRAFAEDRQLQVRAFVVADRDYRLDEELAKEREQLKGPAFRAQRWHVWARAEIENYALVPRAIVRFAERRLDDRFAGEPLFRPDAAEVMTLVEQAIETGREVVEARLSDAFQRLHRGLQASSCTARARELLAAVWQGDRRLEWCDAKDVVLPRLREELHRRWQVTLSERDLIASFQPEDVAEDMRRACEQLAAFALDRN